MTAIRSQHGRLFQRLVVEQRQALLESLALGHGQEIYMGLVGQVRGLDDALRLSEQADFEISGEEPDAGA